MKIVNDALQGKNVIGKNGFSDKPYLVITTKFRDTSAVMAYDSRTSYAHDFRNRF